MSSGEINRKRVVVSGRVQGVCFRYYTQERARQLHIRGWVRNLYSRQVEAVIEGKGSDISNMIDWMRSGPPMAHVTDITVVEEPYKAGDFVDFDVRY
ncbi:MAG: acylphosphatase [Candidatus Aureabacteria bacterium]|nr:acylphosphatase [Candidatus Auribacterota bacterium]